MPKKNTPNPKINSDEKQKLIKKRKHENVDEDYHDSHLELTEGDQNDDFEKSKEFILDDLAEERIDVPDSDKHLSSRTRSKTTTTTTSLLAAREERVAPGIDIPPKKRLKYSASSNHASSRASSSTSTTGTPVAFFPPAVTATTTVTNSHAQATVSSTGVSETSAFSHFRKLK